MRLPRTLVAGVGGLLAAGLVPSPALRATGSPQGLTTACAAQGRAHLVHRPKFVRRIATGETGWFSSPSLVDLDGDGRKEIVAPFYSTFVFNAKGRQLARATKTQGRVYAPSVVADLDGDGKPEIVVGGTGSVAAYDYRHGKLHLVPGWPASVRSGGQTPEVRGLAAADLNGDGRIEVVATTTNTSPTGAQVFVLNARGNRFQPRHGHHPAWPRYNRLAGKGNDLHFNGVGQPRLRRVRRERRHREHRRRSRPGDHHHLRQPPDQRLQRRRHLGAGLPLVHQPRVRRGAAGGWVGGSSSGGPTRGSRGVSTTSTRGPGPARPTRPGCSGPRRPLRSPTSTATAATR